MRKFMIILGIILLLALIWALYYFSHTHTTTDPVLKSAESAQNTPLKTLSIKQPKHIVIVMEENHSYEDIIGNKKAPFINQLANGGALFTQAYAVTHPSQPNYIALFSGSTQGVKGDRCPQTINGSNLASILIKQGYSFAGYSEDLPSVGYKGCHSDAYYRKHAPWTNFTDMPASINQPFSYFPKDFNQLPTVSFVIPNQNHDMHDGTIGQADTWLRSHMNRYIQWAKTHQSILILTWDEDDRSKNNHIPFIIVGGNIQKGQVATPIDHYSVLKTIESIYNLPDLGASKKVSPITRIWKR